MVSADSQTVSAETLPPIVGTLIEKIYTNHNTKVEIREIILSGKSGAIVSVVDCVGDHDGIFILKVDKKPTDWDSEETHHKRAISDGAFSNKIPEIVLSEQSDGHYCLLTKIAGQSRIGWRPLVASLGLFRTAYKKFSTIAWTTSLFNFGPQTPAAKIISNLLGYKLIDVDGGRVEKNISTVLGSDFLSCPLFVHCDQQLPNPFVFAKSTSIAPVLRPLLGPVHGDCHYHNLFVTAGRDLEISDMSVIDLATYQSSSLMFFDHAYLELATMLQQLNQIGDRRWLQFVEALSDEKLAPVIEPQERGWLEDVRAARNNVFDLASSTYPDRMDDLRLQFQLAHVSAGLAFLNKLPQQGAGSRGLTSSQYRQSFIWSAVFLRQLLTLAEVATESVLPAVTSIPVLGGVVPTTGPVPSAAEWESVKYFDPSGFNVLVLPERDKLISAEIMDLPWTLVIDFRTTAPDDQEFDALSRPFRLTWPGESHVDSGLLTRGGIWYFANGRGDISGVEPTATPPEWRRRYRRNLDDLLDWIAESVAPVDVRGLVIGNGFSDDQLRMLVESLDTSFHSGLAPIVVTSQLHPLPVFDAIATIPTTVEAAIVALRRDRAPSSPRSDIAALPQRHGASVRLAPVPPEMLARVSRDFTVLFSGRAQDFPQNRVFGVDFRRGMPIEWAELARNIDVPRAKIYDEYVATIDHDLGASSNRTVNLLHEPSAGGTTLGRRIAWTFIDKVPTLLLDQITEDTSSYLREIFQFCSLPILVLMDGSIITESEREVLLQQLREDNTRAVFLWVSRAYGNKDPADILPGQLEDSEASLFLNAYLAEVTDEARRTALQRLTYSTALRDQRSPFFFGLTAFGKNFLGVDRLIDDVILSLPTEKGHQLICDLALVSSYSSDGFPTHEFDELSKYLIGHTWLADSNSLFLLRTSAYVSISHALLAERVLAKMARNQDRWRADILQFANTLLDDLARLEHKNSDRVKRVVQTLFITRDIVSTLQADVDAEVGGVPSQRRFSALINDIGNVTQARSIFRRLVRHWPNERHFAAHLVRHLIYEDPKEINEAVRLSGKVEAGAESAEDAALVHVAGMAYRVRMEQVLREANIGDTDLKSIEQDVHNDFRSAIDRFQKSISLNPNNEHGLVATVQTAFMLLRLSAQLAGASDLGAFVKSSPHALYLDALAIAEDSIDVLRNRPRLSIRSERAIAEWNLVYGRIDRVVSELRLLASRHEDPSIRRALSSAIVARAKYSWSSISQGDLRTICLMMERNIAQQGVRNSDIRRWLSAYRRLKTFDLEVAIERMIDWHSLSPNLVDPAFYIYVFYFLRWLDAPTPREGLALEVDRWIKVCQANRPIGFRSWSYEWLEKTGKDYQLAHFRGGLDFDPPSVIRDVHHRDRRKLEHRLARISGVLRNYRGPQNASLDLGNGIFMKITPLDRLSKDDEGKKVSVFASFTYDGIIGWDPQLVTSGRTH